jgi:hypothetical protein
MASMGEGEVLRVGAMQLGFDLPSRWAIIRRAWKGGKLPDRTRDALNNRGG